MQTRKSFLAMAALAPLVGPAAGRRGIQRRLQRVLVQGHGGSEVQVYPELLPGRLVVLNMAYANSAVICGPGRDVFMYALTQRAAIDRPAELRRYLDTWGERGGWRFLGGDEELLLRFGLGRCHGK